MGRPRQHEDDAAKLREFRRRRAVRDELTGRLLLAVRNARLEDEGLHRVAQHGEDEELLRALAEWYEARNWNRHH